MMRNSQIVVRKWMFLVGGIVAIALVSFWLLMVWAFQAGSHPDEIPTAVITIIAAPTATPTLSPDELLTPSPTPPGYISPEGITLGAYVQITGTEGAGLRIRSGPGTGNKPLFLGLDAEVFLVKEGPAESDGFTWWLLEAPYDSTRAGWAASKYLQVVAPPQ